MVTATTVKLVTPAARQPNQWESSTCLVADRIIQNGSVVVLDRTMVRHFFLLLQLGLTTKATVAVDRMAIFYSLSPPEYQKSSD